MKRYFLLLLLFIPYFQVFSQHMLGMAQSNYSGITGVHYNPALLADSRYKLLVNIFTFNLYAQNNWVNLELPYKPIKALRGKYDSTSGYLDSNNVPLFTNDMLIQKANGRRKYMYFSSDIVGPSAMLNLKEKSGIAFSYRLRTNAYIANFDNSMMNFFFLSGFDSATNNSFNNKNYQKFSSRQGSKHKAGIGVNVFQQYTGTYSRVLKDGDKHFLSGGVSLSYLAGLGAAFVRLNNFNYNQPSSDSVNVKGVDLEYGYVNPQFFTRVPPPTVGNYYDGGKLGKGASVDIGLSYERRIKKEEYTYNMDKGTHEDRSMTKYLYRLGVSLVDFGSVNYNNSKYITHVKLKGDTLVPLKWSSLNGGKQFKTVEEADSFINGLFPQHDSATSFKAKLPAAMHFQADVNLGNNFFVGGQYTQNVRLRSKEGIKVKNVLYIAPRYETKDFEISFSLLFGNYYHKVQTGLYLRGGPFFIGTDNLGSLMGTKSTNGLSLYTGFTVPIRYKRLMDLDEDFISDKLDKCPGEKGSAKANGCPDKDNDGVADSEDECPKEPGRKGSKGCPDEDQDKIWGKADKCPDKPGKKDNAGCPDTDGDGLFDHKDKCPDAAGPKTNGGCPIKEVVKKPEPKKEEMDFKKYYYYPVIGAFGVKENADKFSKSFTEKTGVKTSVIFNKDKKLYYITTGKLENRESAEKVIQKLNLPEINSLINGKVWMYPEVR